MKTKQLYLKLLAGVTLLAAFVFGPATVFGQSLYVDSTGNVGVGTQTPSATFEIEGASGTSQFLVDEQNANAAVEVMFNLVCNCAPGFRMQNTTNGRVWFFRHLSGGNFSFDDPNSPGQEMLLTGTGNLILKGTISQGSSRAIKENLRLADGDSVLVALDELDVYEWSYIKEGTRHLGPMSEDFAAAYGLGNDSKKLAPGDMAGVALAAAKALRQKNESLEAQLEAVLKRLAILEAP